MTETTFSCITLRALLHLYQIPLQPMGDGRYSGRLPWSVRPGSALILSTDGGSWSTNDESPQGGDRLDFIMQMECVTRERASELLHGSFPAILEREGIPEDGISDEADDSRPGHERFRATARHAATQVDIEETMWLTLAREGR